jgi:hypothetical protein
MDGPKTARVLGNVRISSASIVIINYRLGMDVGETIMWLSLHSYERAYKKNYKYSSYLPISSTPFCFLSG